MALDLKPAPGGRRQAFRVAMRMARRDIRRHQGRSLLIILLIMLPVAAMTGAVTLFQSTQETAAERVQYQLGGTQARFRPMAMTNGQMVQDPVDETRIASGNWDQDLDFKPKDPQELVPAGYSVLTETTLDLTAESGAAEVPLVGRAVDALAPAFAGKYTLLQGRAPGTGAEMLVSPGLLERFALELGEKLATSAGTFVVVGTLRDAGYSDSNSIVYLKPGQGGLDDPAPADSAPGEASAVVVKASLYYVVGPEPVTWNQVREANAAGVAVLSRSVALNPPPEDQLGTDGTSAQFNNSTPFAAYATGAFLGALALLEVGLLAGAAFAVGAKGQVRELALLAASGAERDSSLILWSIVGLGALITLSAAGITTGLSLADSRKDHVTLAGVGAAPGLRKALAGSQALMTSGLGTVLGSMAGIVPAVLLVTATGLARTAVVPWLQLAALLVAVPLTGAALAWLFTRAKLPMSRREVWT